MQQRTQCLQCIGEKCNFLLRMTRGQIYPLLFDVQYLFNIFHMKF